MRQAVWKRKAKDNDHRDIGHWKGVLWFHFLDKGEECLGHQGKGDWICHNHAGKSESSITVKPKKVVKRVVQGIAPKAKGNKHLLTKYKDFGVGFKPFKALVSLKDVKNAFPERKKVKRPPLPKDLPTFGLNSDNLKKLQDIADKIGEDL